MADIIFIGKFIASKVGKTGLADVTVDVDSYTFAAGVGAAEVTGGSATERRNGLYFYRLAGATLATKMYTATFKTADATVDAQQVDAIGLVPPDELVSSRLATSGYTAPLDAAGVRAALGLAAANLDTQLSGVAASVWGYTTRTLTSLAALLSGIAGAVWAYATRTLTSTAAQTAAAVAGSALVVTRRATFRATLTGLTISASRDRLWFTIKASADDADEMSVVQIVASNPADAGDGLLYLDGAAGTAARGSLTVDQAAGTVTIWLADEATAAMRVRAGLVYDLKERVAGDTTVLTSGTASVTTTPTAAM